jgi:2-polyprenyl-3-methyl-5-hydroxy-6-metoxy-1,4-benzoquinol methylase
VARALALDGRGRLLDVGCGPGIVALELTSLFEEVVGLDADPDMIAEAKVDARRRASLCSACSTV